MKADPLSDIRTHLETYGWTYQQQDASSLVTHFLGPTSDTEFVLLFRVTEHWLSMTVWPLLPRPDSSRLEPLASMLSRLNYELKMARFASTPDGSIVLGLELPLDHLTEGLFTVALDTLSFYADELFPQLVTAWAGNLD